MDVVRGSDRLKQAEALAATRGAELQVVSRWAGETEKSLRALFERAEASGAILFFEDADDLFGRDGAPRETALARLAAEYPRRVIVGVREEQYRLQHLRRPRD